MAPDLVEKWKNLHGVKGVKYILRYFIIGFQKVNKSSHLFVVVFSIFLEMF